MPKNPGRSLSLKEYAKEYLILEGSPHCEGGEKDEGATACRDGLYKC